MKRVALLFTAVVGLAAGIAACGESPVQPAATTSAADVDPTFARKATAPTCESLIYPTSLCVPSFRPTLCQALIGPDPVTFDVTVFTRPATATFTRMDGGSSEVVTIPRPYGLPPIVLTFTITDSQIATICA